MTKPTAPQKQHEASTTQANREAERNQSTRPRSPNTRTSHQQAKPPNNWHTKPKSTSPARPTKRPLSQQSQIISIMTEYIFFSYRNRIYTNSTFTWAQTTKLEHLQKKVHSAFEWAQPSNQGPPSTYHGSHQEPKHIQAIGQRSNNKE